MIPLLALVRYHLVFVFAVFTVLAGSLARAQQQPRFTQIERDGRISWSSETNVSYQLQRAGQLGGGGWTNVGTAVNGDGGIVSVTQGFQSSGQAFYRVVATNGLSCPNGICATAVHIGPVAGELNQCTSGPTVSGCGNTWFRVTLREANGNETIDMRLDVALDSAAGANYDLFLRDGCIGLLRSSTLGAGIRDEVFYYVTDVDGVNSSRDFWIEVRRAMGSPIGTWTLRTSGGTGPCY